MPSAAQAAGHYSIAVNTTMVRTFDLQQYGKLNEAARYCQSIIEYGVHQGQKVFYPAGSCYIGLAGVYLERYELKKLKKLSNGEWNLSRGRHGWTLRWLHLESAFATSKGRFRRGSRRVQLLKQAFQRRDFTLAARQVSIQLAMGILPALLFKIHL